MKPDSSVHLFNAEDVLMIGDTSDRPAELHEKLGSLIRMSRKIRADVESLSMKTGEYRILLRGTLDTVKPGVAPEPPPPETRPPGLDDSPGGMEPPKADEPAPR